MTTTVGSGLTCTFGAPLNRDVRPPMGAIRKVVVVLAVVAMIVSVVGLVAATHDSIEVMRLSAVPITIVVFAAWFLALQTATKVAHGTKADGIPGIAQFYGLFVAGVRAPAWALSLSALSGIAIAVCGSSGIVHHLSTPYEARVTGSALLGFLLLSIPVLTSRHPVAISIGGLTTRSSGP